MQKTHSSDMFAKRNFIVNILRRCSHSSGNKVPVDMRIQSICVMLQMADVMGDIAGNRQCLR